MSGFGRVLTIDPGSGHSRRWQVDPAVARVTIGGRGLGARLLLTECLLPDGTEPLSPGNLLMFVTGPPTGTPFPGSGKYVVITRSPASGTFLDSYSRG